MDVDRRCHSNPRIQTVWDIVLTVWAVISQAGHEQRPGTALYPAGFVSFEDDPNQGSTILAARLIFQRHFK